MSGRVVVLPTRVKPHHHISQTRAVLAPRPGDGSVRVSNSVSARAGADVAVTEPGGVDGRAEQPEPFGVAEDGPAGGDGYGPQPPTPDKEDALQAAAVANLRAALMSKNSLLSLKADMLGEDSSLLFEYLPKGTHSLSRKFVFFIYSLFTGTLSEIFSEKKIQVTCSFIATDMFILSFKSCLILLPIKRGNLCLVSVQLQH